MARIAAAFLRRPAPAIIVTIGSGHLIRPGLAHWNAMTKPTPMGVLCVFGAVMMSMIAVYSAVRRGPSDPVTKTAGVLGLVSSAALSFWQSIWGTAICGLVAVALIAAFLGVPAYRRALLWVLAAGASAPVGLYIAWFSLFPILSARLAPHDPWRVRWFELLMDVSASLAIAACLSWSKPAQEKQRPNFR